MPPDAPDLLERQGEVDAVRRALDAAVAGAGSTVVLRADAGLGKSALLAAAGDLAQARGMTVLRARAAWLDSDIPFGVARRLIAPLARDPQMRERVFAGDGALAGELFDRGWSGQPDDVAVGVREGLCAIVEAASSGAALALLVDDLQWADRQSVRFLLTLAGRIDEQAVSVLCARRPGPTGSETPPPKPAPSRLA